MALAQLIQVVYVDAKQGTLSDVSIKNFEGLSSEVVNSLVDAVTHAEKNAAELKAIQSDELQTMKTGKSRTRNSREDKEILDFVEKIHLKSYVQA